MGAGGGSRAAIIGCGEQGRYHAQMLRALNPSATIVGYDTNPERAAELIDGAEPAASATEAVTGVDIAISAAPIVKDAVPALDAGVLGDGWLGLPIDFDAYFSPALRRLC